MTAMLIGTALALGALMFVLFPLFRDPLDLGRSSPRASAVLPALSAVDALREIEFDHATGKLSETDYAELKSTYTQRAVMEMRHQDTHVVICGTCGPRSESDARFCSSCGRQLAA